MTYRAPVEDYQFIFDHVVGLEQVTGTERFAEATPDLRAAILGEAGRMSLGNVLVQSYVDDDYRGRVMSVFMMQRSLASLGTFFVGVLASVAGVQVVIGALAVALFALASVAIFLTPTLRDLD